MEPGGRVASARSMIAWILLYSIPLLTLLRPVTDPDVFWHLETGRWIVEHGRLPETDPFSTWGVGRPWEAYSWLFGLLVHGLHQLLGFHGILLYRIVLSLASIAAIDRLVRKREPRFLVATGLVAAAAGAIVPTLHERPWLFTILFFTLTLDAVLDLRAGVARRTVWLLPIAYALWANLHIQFAFGLFVLGLASAVPLLEGRAARTREWRILCLLTALCFAATLANPYGLRLYRVGLELATQRAPFVWIAELQPMKFRSAPEWAVLALAATAVWTLGRRAAPCLFSTALLLAAAYFSMRLKRDVWCLSIAATAVAASNRPFPRFADRAFELTGRRATLLAGALLALAAAGARLSGLSRRGLDEAIERRYPARAAAVVESRGYAGPLYNPFTWGGYLIWRLPGLPVSIDGRTLLHGDERIERYMTTWRGGKDWASDPELAAAGVVIAATDTALFSLLVLDPRFELAYEDEISAVFVARRPSSR